MKPNWSKGMKRRSSLRISVNRISASEGEKKEQREISERKRKRKREGEGEEAMDGGVVQI